MGGFVPGFDNDIFISYAHDDDASWHKMFEESLRAELAGLRVSIWQDTKRLRVGQSWPEEIIEAIRKSAVFIAVLSPLSQDSWWCTKERDLFRKGFGTQEEFEKSGRAFKIVKAPWEDDGHREYWKNIEDLEFFRRTNVPGVVEPFEPGSLTFRNAIAVLANSVALTLRRLRSSHVRVFVASPPEDCKKVWDDLRAELHANDYDVQPKGARDGGYTDPFIEKEIGHASLSIHLLGAAYDPFDQRQIQLAAGLERKLIFWLAPGSNPDESQKQLIASLRAGWRPDLPTVRLPPQWDLLENLTPRQLINHVVTRLAPRSAVPPPPPSPGAASRLYIIHDAKTDEDDFIVSTLQREIRAREREKIDVILSPADQQQHKDILKTCEGVLLYGNAAPVKWLNQFAPDVLLADRSRAPFKSRAFLVSDTARWDGWPDLRVFPYTPDFKSSDLEPFLEPLRS